MNKQRMILSKVVPIAVACLIICVSCAVNRVSSKPKLMAVDLYTVMPMGVYQNMVNYDSTIITLYSLDSVNLYKIPVRRNTSVISTDKEGNQLGDTLISLPNAARCFYYHTGDAKGIFNDTALATSVWAVLVDSFLKERSVTNFEVGLRGMIETSNLVKSDADREAGLLMEKYVPRNKPELGWDTLVLHYSKNIRTPDFSFSRKQDSLHSSKLCKIEVKFKAIPEASLPDFRVDRLAVLEIREHIIRDTVDIMNLLSKMEGLRLKQRH